MKKKYTPPAIYVEDLTLSHHIAACSGVIVKLNSANADVCGGDVIGPTGFPNLGHKVFTDENPTCFNINEGYVPVEEYCYTKQDAGTGFYFGS